MVSFYLEILKFIKINGTKQIFELIESFKYLKYKSKEEEFNEYIFNSFDIYNFIYNKGNNKKVIDYLRTIKKHSDITDDTFISFITFIDNNIKDIDIIIDNFIKMKEYGIQNIIILKNIDNYFFKEYESKQNYINFVSQNNIYSDGKINDIIISDDKSYKKLFPYKEYEIKLKDASFIINEEILQDKIIKTIYITSFEIIKENKQTNITRIRR